MTRSLGQLRVDRPGPIPHCAASSTVRDELANGAEKPCGSGLQATATPRGESFITKDAKFSRALLDAKHIDRLNIGALPTVQLNWFQPHEGSIVDFLFRARAYQTV